MTLIFSSQFNYGGFEMKMHVLALAASTDHFALNKGLLLQELSGVGQKEQ